jgi:hypothetical protein
VQLRRDLLQQQHHVQQVNKELLHQHLLVV